MTKTDEAGNIKPDKKRATERIDGAIATIMSLDRAVINSVERYGGGITVFDFDNNTVTSSRDGITRKLSYDERFGAK